MDKKWKYDDTNCSGCNKYEETGEEITRCTDLCENEENITYNWFLEADKMQLRY
jgi:hypothetical protein